jgi:hypothetical protein
VFASISTRSIGSVTAFGSTSIPSPGDSPTGSGTPVPLIVSWLMRTATADVIEIPLRAAWRSIESRTVTSRE